MRHKSRIVLCGAILSLAAALFADERSTRRDISRLGQTSYVRAVTLHRIDSAAARPKKLPISETATKRPQSRLRLSHPKEPLVLLARADVNLESSRVEAQIHDVLMRWEQASQQAKSAECEITRWVYDNVFEVEKRGIGKLAYVEDKLFAIQIEPFKIDPQSKPSRKIGKRGVPFKMEAANPETWVFTDNEIRVIDDSEKSIEIIPIPPDARGEKLPFAFNFGLPFRFLGSSFPSVFNVRAADLKKRFDVSVEDRNALIVTLVAVEARDKQLFREAFIKLDKKTFLPEAMKVTDPAGHLETVYQFTNWKVSDKIADAKDIPIANKRYFGYKRNILAISTPSKPDAANAQAAHGAPAQKPTGEVKARLILPAPSESRWWSTGMAAIELASARPVTAFLVYAAGGDRKNDEPK